MPIFYRKSGGTAEFEFTHFVPYGTELSLIHIYAAYGVGIPEGTLNIIEDTSRETATQLMKMNGYVDLLIPRGGKGLIRSVVENATVPVVETAAGNCHVYVDADADVRCV